MEQDNFIELISELFEVTPKKELNNKTEFKNLDEWDSLLALEIIALIDEEYDIDLDGDSIRDANTFEDLHDIVKSRLNGI